MTGENLSPVTIATSRAPDNGWRGGYEVETIRLDKIYGPFTEEKARELRDTHGFKKIDPVVGQDWAEMMRSSEDPVTTALYNWSLYPDKNEYHSKELLDQMIAEFPDKAQQVQDFTAWLYLHRCLEQDRPTVTLYRANKVGHDVSQVRPWESLTDDKEFAQKLCDSGKRVLVTYEVPATSIFASYASSAGLANFEVREKEIILNSNGGVGVEVTGVDESGKITVELSKQLDNLIEELGSAGVMYEEFLNDQRCVDILEKIPERNRALINKKIKEEFNVVEDKNK